MRDGTWNPCGPAFTSAAQNVFSQRNMKCRIYWMRKCNCYCWNANSEILLCASFSHFNNNDNNNNVNNNVIIINIIINNNNWYKALIIMLLILL